MYYTRCWNLPVRPSLPAVANVLHLDYIPCLLYIVIEMAAILSNAEIQARREEQYSVLLEQQALNPGHSHYKIACPCMLNPCNHEIELPVLYLTRCLLPGELDYFLVTEPFLAEYNFRTSWICFVCKSEYSCGIDASMR